MRGTSKAPPSRTKSKILKRLRTRFGVPAALIAVLALALPAGASADGLGANSEFFAPEAPANPVTLAEGPDGNTWFTDPTDPSALTSKKIGKVTPAGVVTEYSPTGMSGGAWSIAKGPDGNIWFTEPGSGVKKVGHIDPSAPTTSLVEIEVPNMPFTGGSFKSYITTGPDGNLWVTLGANGLARITPAGVVTEYPASTPGFNGGIEICSITAGPDVNVWFGDCGTTKAVGKITPAGVITEYAVKGESGNLPESIAKGSDGRLWFPAANAADERLGAITTAGVVTYYKTPTFPASFGLDSLTAGPDGNVWGAEASGENEKQTATIVGEEGLFRLSFEGQKTGWTGTGTLTSGSASVTGVTTSTGSPTVGELVKGTGIKANTRVSSCAPVTTPACTNPTSITLSATVTASGSQSLSADLGLTPLSALPSSAATVKTALEKLSTIATTVTVGGVGSFNPPTTNRAVTFEGKLTRADVPLMTCEGIGLAFENEETEEIEPGSCAVANTGGKPFVERLFRIKPATGAMKGFELKSTTALQSFAKANALAAGPGKNLWYTAEGITPAIGKFGTEGADLTVVKEGSGDGTVVSSPAGIECDPTCSASFAKGTKVTLTASPDSESLFTSWKGCETGGAIGRQCTVTIGESDLTVNAKFTTAYDVTVSRKGTGLGKVGSSPGGVLCLSNCSSTSAKFKELTNVTLTATPSKHFTFEGWSGDCSGKGTCVLSSLEADKSAEAEFAEVAKFDLTVTKTGGGQGTVKAKQAGINCGATCSTMAAKYYEGEVIELLVPTPGKGSTFEGWSGSGCTGKGTCLVTMSGAKSVNAEFK